MYDLIIIGGGPGGIAAGVYAARKKIKTLLIAESIGGQSMVSAEIKNWIGTKSISGFDFSKVLEEHLRDQEDIEIRLSDRVVAVRETRAQGLVFEVETEKSDILQTKTIIVTTGSRRRKLGVSGEDTFEGKGVAYCSTCDAPLFSGKIVAVVGGGNAGLEAVVDLFPYAKKVYLLEYGNILKGDPVTQQKIASRGDFVEIILNAETQAIEGDKFVTGLRYKDRVSGETKQLSLEGVFVEIGATPNSEMVGDLVERNKLGEIIIDSKTGQTSKEGIWAAGDVTDDPFKQNNISAGDAVKATLSAYRYLLSN